jgi:hypothetical protein
MCPPIWKRFAIVLTPRIGRFATFVFLIFVATPFGAEAQQYACWPIVRGDTAAGLALRLTGDARNRHAGWFQIVDPARRTVVPKAEYDRLQPRWQVCVAPTASGGVVPVTAGAGADPSRYDVGLACRVGVAVSMLLFAFSRVETYVAERRIPPEVRRAGEAFVHSFARPLIDPSAQAPPIRARLRWAAEKQQLEILIAPNGGRTYPNLADHKANLEYDVDRIVQGLGRPFVAGEGLRAEGQWVVIALRQADLQEAGGK